MLRSMFPKGDLTSASILATVAASWGILLAWTSSPYSAYLGHSELAEVSSVVQLLPLSLGFFAGWIVMLFAMMIPAAAPFVTQFRLRKSGEGLLLPLLGGYLATWALFGLMAYFSDLGLHRLSETSLLQGHAWVFGPSALVLAAGYQFTSTKNQFLKDCCYPSDFIQSHWTGQGGGFSALRLGFAYGKSSLGSGWAVMLLMFALGLGSVLWMLAFALVMMAEGLTEWGPRIRLPLGVVLAGIAFYSVVVAIGL
ncbi:MAG TPA: DUF2182 domain-containing protein [Nitrososphaerales archaeon]|nr:DUF2182 domain-containing protein [Nitrososphaerales archaeon]